MAGRGNKVTFHGVFGSKRKAAAKERRVKGGYVIKRKIRGDTRYIVLRDR